MTKRFTPELALVDPDLADVLRTFLSDPPDCLAPRVSTASTAVALLPATATPALEDIRSADVAPPRAPVEPLAQERRVRRSAARLPQVAAYLLSLGIITVPFLAFLPPAESQRPRFVGLPRVADEQLASSPARERRATLPKPLHPAARASAESRKQPAKRPRSAPSERPAFEPTPKATKQPAAGTRAENPTKAEAKAKAKAKAKAATKPKPSTSAKTDTQRAAPETRKSPKPASKPAAPRTIDWPAAQGADLYNVIIVRGGKRRDTWVEGTTVSVERLAPVKSGGRPLVNYRWYVYPLYREDGAFRFGPLTAQGSISLPPGAASK